MKPFRGTVGVFGGAFDPPHLGHAMLPAYVLARGLADTVVVAPCADHPLGKPMRPFVDRLAWTAAAMRPLGDAAIVTDLEAQLAARAPGPSYTLRLLEAVAAHSPGARVRLIVGSDIVATGQTQRWHRWDAIEAGFDPIVVPRAGYCASDEVALPELSSTDLRAWIESEDWDRVATAVPAAVLHALRDADRHRAVWLVGRGHVTAHVAPWLRARGFAVTVLPAHAVADETVVWPDVQRPPAAVWLLARDPALARVADGLGAGPLPSDVPVFHAAGALPARAALPALADRAVGTLHPICSLRSERPFPSPIWRAAFGVEGHGVLRRAALELIGEAPNLDLTPLDADARAAYHAACSLVANHLAAVVDPAAQVLRAQGHPADAVALALGRLLGSSVANLDTLGIPAGITGPVARGDTHAVAAHLAALPDDTAALYRVLSDRLAKLV